MSDRRHYKLMSLDSLPTNCFVRTRADSVLGVPVGHSSGDDLERVGLE